MAKFEDLYDLFLKMEAFLELLNLHRKFFFKCTYYSKLGPDPNPDSAKDRRPDPESIIPKHRNKLLPAG
jgi:hypothetical protein